MKILFWQWHSFMNKGIENALKKLNIDYDVFFCQLSDWEQDDVFAEKLHDALNIGNAAYTMIFSVNFCPLIAKECQNLGLKYISWVYDSPVHIRDLKTMKYSCNEIYFFDRGQADIYKAMGIPAFHMPLAVDIDVFKTFPSAAQRNVYSADISFVGQLYKTDYDYFRTPLSDYLKGFLDSIIAAQGKLTGAYIIPEVIADSLLIAMNEDYKNASGGTFQMERRELEYMLACETTSRERFIALALLSEHFGINMYSQKEDPRLRNVIFKGYADYYKDMPYIFALSRLNLNISLKTIRTGIPLRVIDIMGCGGVAVTGISEETLEYLHPGEDCIVYTDIPDMFEKCSYYLSHEEERKQIAAAALQTAKENFSFEDRIKKMIRL